MMRFRFGKDVSRVLVAGIVLATQTAPAQQSVSAKEKAAADAVAKIVEQTRMQNRLPRLRRIKDRYLRPNACERAKSGDKSPGQTAGIGPPEKVGMMSVLWYSTLDPNQAPAELLDFARGPEPQWEQPHRFAVGVCLAGTAEHSDERYWIEVGTYMSAIKSFFYAPMWD